MLVLTEALRDRKEAVCYAAASALAGFGAQAADSLCRALRDRSERIHRTAGSALEQIGPPAVEPLCRALRDGDPRVRRFAAKTLGEFGHRAALPALRARLRLWWGEPETSICDAVIVAIDKIERDTSATQALPRAAEPESPTLKARPRVADDLVAWKRPRERH
jgi:HEAT repeat protein